MMPIGYETTSQQRFARASAEKEEREGSVVTKSAAQCNLDAVKTQAKKSLRIRISLKKIKPTTEIKGTGKTHDDDVGCIRSDVVVDDATIRPPTDAKKLQQSLPTKKTEEKKQKDKRRHSTTKSLANQKTIRKVPPVTSARSRASVKVWKHRQTSNMRYTPSIWEKRSWSVDQNSSCTVPMRGRFGGLAAQACRSR